MLPYERGAVPHASERPEVGEKDIKSAQGTPVSSRRHEHSARFRSETRGFKTHANVGWNDAPEYVGRETERAQRDDAHPGAFGPVAERLPFGRGQSVCQQMHVIQKAEVRGIVMVGGAMQTGDGERVHVREASCSAWVIGDGIARELGIRQRVGEHMRICDAPMHVVGNRNTAAHAVVSRLLRDETAARPRKPLQPAVLKQRTHAVRFCAPHEHIGVATRSQPRFGVVRGRKRGAFENERPDAGCAECGDDFAKIARAQFIDERRLARQVVQPAPHRGRHGVERSASA